MNSIAFGSELFVWIAISFTIALDTGILKLRASAVELKGYKALAPLRKHELICDALIGLSGLFEIQALSVVIFVAAFPHAVVRFVQFKCIDGACSPIAISACIFYVN